MHAGLRPEKNSIFVIGSRDRYKVGPWAWLLSSEVSGSRIMGLRVLVCIYA